MFMMPTLAADWPENSRVRLIQKAGDAVLELIRG
jgi:hypothetical protein